MKKVLMKKVLNFKYVAKGDGNTNKFHVPNRNFDVAYPPLFDYQNQSLNKIIGNTYPKWASIIAPTGSGKGTIILTYAYELLKQFKKLKVLIIAPQKIIIQNYDSYAYTYKKEKIDFIPKIINSNNNIELLKIFLETPTVPEEVGGRIAVCTHASAVKLFTKLSDKEKGKLFKNVCVWFDEAHHISSTEFKDGDKFRNGLSDLAHFLLGNNNRMGLASATLYRSDNTSVIEKKYTDKFSTFKYDFYEYFDSCKFLKGVNHYTYLYQKKRSDVIEDIISKKKKGYGTTVFYIPHVNSIKMKNKYKESKEIAKFAKLKGLSVLSLVPEETQQKNSELLNDLNITYKEYSRKRIMGNKNAVKPDPEKHIDIIISLNMGKEGFDFLPIDTIVLLEDRSSIGDVIQTVGRGLRDYPDKKSIIDVYHVLPGHLQKLDPDLTKKIISNNIASFVLALKMEDLFTPIPKIKGDTKKGNYSLRDYDYDDIITDIYGDILHSIIRDIPSNIPSKEKWNILTDNIISYLKKKNINDDTKIKKICDRVKRRIFFKCYGGNELKTWNWIGKNIDISDIGIKYIIKGLGYSNLEKFKQDYYPNEYLSYKEVLVITHYENNFKNAQEYQEHIKEMRIMTDKLMRGKNK